VATGGAGARGGAGATGGPGTPIATGGPSGAGRLYARIPDRGPGGFDGQLLAFGEELRGEGMRLGTSELLDAFAALEQISWTVQADFKAALAATLAKSPEDRHTFELVFDRFFFRAAEAEAARRQISEGAIGAEQSLDVDLDELRRQIAAALREGSDAALRDLARLAIAAFGAARARACSGSTCSGSAARWGCAPSRSRTCRPTTRAATASRGSSCAASSPTCGASSSET
jgi:hypothetical protein